MTMRPLQNQVTDIAVFGLTVALLGFVAKMVRDMTAGAMGSAKAPALLPATAKEPDTSWQPPLIPETRITYYTVSFQGDTTFKVGEIVSEQAFKAENDRVMKLELRPARGWVSSKGELLSWGYGRRPVKELEECLPASIPRDDLMRIADKYSWWAAKLAEAVCPHNDVACVEREARRLVEARRIRLE